MANRLAAAGTTLCGERRLLRRARCRPTDVPKITAPLLLHYAGLDERINAGIAAFEAALKANGKPYELHMYEGANHAFNNDTNAARYDKKAADLAWGRTVAFFEEASRGIAASRRAARDGRRSAARGDRLARGARARSSSSRTRSSSATCCTRLLAGAGYRVIAARDGEEAVREYEAHRDEVDLVLMDYGLPRLSGAEAFARLQQVDPAVQVVIVSGNLDPDVRRRLVDAGLAGFVQKPYTAEAMLGTIRERLRAR